MRRAHSPFGCQEITGWRGESACTEDHGTLSSQMRRDWGVVDVDLARHKNK